MRYEIIYDTKKYKDYQEKRDGIITKVVMNNKKDRDTAIKILDDLGAPGSIEIRDTGRGYGFDYTSGSKYFWMIVHGHNGSNTDGRFYTDANRRAAIKIIKAAGMAEYHMTKTCIKRTRLYQNDRVNLKDPRVFDGKGWHTYYHKKPLKKPVISHHNYGDATLQLMEQADEQRKAAEGQTN